jgi:hypothetical protein
MKRIFTLFALLACTFIFAQHKVANKVAEYKALNAKFNHFSVLTVVDQPTDNDVSRAVNKSTLAQINTTAVNDIVNNKYETLEVEVPYQGNTILVELYKVNPFNANFHVDTDKAKYIDYTRGVYYRGIVNGDENSIATFNFFNNELNAIISAEGLNNLVVGKLDKTNNASDYIIYSDAEMRVLNGFNCGMKDDNTPHEDHAAPNTSRDIQTERCVTMYFEIDNDLYVQNGSNTTTTTNWMTSVFNNMQTLYENDGITISLKSLYIWTEDDPYELELFQSESSSDYLFMFNQVRPVFDGDVGQLVGIDPNGLGGVAVTIDGLCTQNNFSYSDVFISYSSVPTWSWTVQVITHEMGHLLGSRHTHACVWNGNNTSIDGCGTQAGYTEGNCALGPIPSSSVKGTIMSYCHLIGGVGISFNNGFGPQPSDAIYTTVEASECLSTDCINTCINTVVDITVTNPTNTSATITWSDLGNATSWEVSVSTFGSTIINYVTVNTNSYTTTAPLNMNAYYKVRIRPICENASTTTYRQAVFATPTNWCNGVVITDTGGTGSNYTNDQHYTRVIMPNLPQKKIRLEFTQFSLEQDFDYLTIYDGVGTGGMLWGTFTGTDIASIIESNSPDGALTLDFFSDQGVVDTGYAANVTCLQSLGLNGFGDIDFTYYPNPANGYVNIISNTEIEDIMVYNVQGQLLYQSKNNGLDKKIDVSAFATGTYFFKLNFAGDKQANFKIMKQ